MKKETALDTKKIYKKWDKYLKEHKEITYKKALELVFGKKISSKDKRYPLITKIYYKFTKDRDLRRKKIGFRVVFFLDEREKVDKKINFDKDFIFKKLDEILIEKGELTYRDSLECITQSGCVRRFHLSEVWLDITRNIPHE